MAFLAAKPLDFADRHPGDADLGEGVLDFFEFERLNYRFDFLHTFDEFIGLVSKCAASLRQFWRNFSYSGSPRTGFVLHAHCFPREGHLAAGVPVMALNNEPADSQL